MTFCPEQSQGYSTRVEQEVEIHYRWHALFGRPVRRLYAERRARGDVVLVEGEPGVAVLVSAWMLDPAACAGMRLGGPHASIEALVDLDRLLTEHGLRRSLDGDNDVAREDRREERIATERLPKAATSAQHVAGLDGTKGDERSRARRRGLAAGEAHDGSRWRRGGGERP
jgi:hypothetical protein